MNFLHYFYKNKNNIMKKQIIWVLLLFIFCESSYTQNIEKPEQPKQVSKLFRDQSILPIKLKYSNKDLKKLTNDSTYVKSNMSYRAEDGSWKLIEVELRVRGNNRLKNCYFPPIKIKLKKENRKGTVFEGNKKLKLVVPCLNNKDKNDYIVKEYMAYKLYEIISPYYFNTRMVNISFTEDKGKKTKTYDLVGFFIEDTKKVAKRHDGKELKRIIHPLNQDPVTAVQNSFFQFMIGNTDFSIAYQHNEKLLFVNKKIVPLPYDFDMCGLVDASYSVVSVINDQSLPINSVRDRLYRGFKRDPKIIQQVRNEFINNKIELLEIVDSLEPLFDDPKKFYQAKNYILSFFDVMTDNAQFNDEITSKLRTK